jgi:hypothetical protein
MTMASPAQVRKPTEEVSVDRLMLTVKKLAEPMGPTHPTNAPTALAQADNALYISQILEIVRGPRPPEGSERRKVYDEAVKVLGEGSKAEAVAYLEKAHMAALENLQKKMAAGEEIGDRGPKVLASLDSVNMDSGNYKGNLIDRLRLQLGGTAGPVVPKAEEQAAGAQALPVFEMPLFDLGPIHLLSSKKDEAMVAFNASSTPTLNSMFGGESNATGAMNALAGAYATLTNHPNDLSAQQAAAKSVYEAFKAIPSNKEIWNASVHPNFAKAMDYFSKGMLQAGLDALSQEPAFNSMYGQMNNLYVVTVNQRAVAVMRAGVTVRYNFDKNLEAFQEFINGSAEKRFEPRLLYLALGLNYEYLAMSGQLTQLTVAPGTGAVTKGKSTPLTGTGNVFSVTPQIGIGTSAWGNPMEIVLHANIGYQQYELGTNVPMSDGTTQKISVGDKGAYIGLWGAEVRFPGKTGQRNLLRIERIGAGNVGATNPMAYITFSGNWKETNKMRLQSFVTPQYSYFLGQHRVGAELKPIDMSFQLHPEWTLNVGPGVRYDYNFGNENHTIEAYVSAGFKYSRGVALDLRGGYITELGGAKGAGERVPGLLGGPGVPYGGINLTLTPAEWFKPSSERKITSDAVPKRKKRSEDTE